MPEGIRAADVSVDSPPSNNYSEWEPRLGATYALNANNVFRASWGEYAQRASCAFQQYNNVGYDLPGFAPNTSLYPLGFFAPSHQVYPELSCNFDLPWEHQVKL